MSKGSGGTRGSSWRDKKRVKDEEAAMKNVVSAISSMDGRRNIVDVDGFASSDWDMLSAQQKVKALEDGLFTGMWQDDAMDVMNDFRRDTKQSIVAEIQDNLQNIEWGYEVEDFNHHVIKFNDSDTPIHTEDLSKPLTQSQISKIEWVSSNFGLTENRYWHNKYSKGSMIAYMNFHEFVKGKEVASYNGRKLKDTAYNY